MQEEYQTPFYLFFGTGRIPLTSQVQIRWLFDDMWKLNLEVVINADTGIDDIIEAWYLIRNERDTLNAHLGTSVAGYLRNLMIMHRDKGYTETTSVNSSDDEGHPPEDELTTRKASNQDLAAEANFDLLLFALNIYNKRPNANLANALFKGLLSEFSFDEKDFDEYLQLAVEELSHDRCPWDIYEEPIRREKMREKIRYLEEKHGRTLIPPVFKLSDIRISFVGEFLDALQLLEETFPETHKRFEPRYWAMFDEILEAYHRRRNLLNKAKKGYPQ